MSADATLDELIAKHGWAVIRVSADEEQPSYAYSVGLFKTFQHPEVIVFGLHLDVLQEIVNVIGERVRRGERFSASRTSTDVLEGYECAFREVVPAAERFYMEAGIRYYGHEFPALHCIWPDRGGRFPWQVGTDPSFRRLQPVLSEGPEPHTFVRP